MRIQAISRAVLFAAGVALAGTAIAGNFSTDLSDSAAEADNQPSLVTVPLDKAYLPDGFDSMNRVRLMVEGVFPNTCYRNRGVQASVHGNIIKITQTALKYKGPCLYLLVSYALPVNIGLLKPGNYTVMDSFTGSVLGELPVKAAGPNKVGPDDYYYANVKDAYITDAPANSPRQVVVKAVFPSNCWSLKETRVLLDGQNVITVLPIMQPDDKPACTHMEQPFTTTVDVPNVANGRYLLQVRSLNGESIMKLVDL